MPPCLFATPFYEIEDLTMTTKPRLNKFKELKYQHAIKTRLRYFVEGYVDHLQGANFSMTPYPLSPSPSYASDNEKTKRKYWSRGYWAAERVAKRKRA